MAPPRRPAPGVESLTRTGQPNGAASGSGQWLWHRASCTPRRGSATDWRRPSRWVGGLPAGRLQTADEVAAMATFLFSPPATTSPAQPSPAMAA